MLRAFIALLWVLMSPQAMDAFGQLTRAEITSGVMDLEDAMTGTIYAIGKKNGQTWQIEAGWRNGYPLYFLFTNPEPGL